VLRTPYHDETQLKSDLSQLAISLNVYAINHPPKPADDGNTPQGPPPVQSKDLIWSGCVSTADDPVIVVQRSSDNSGGQHVLVFWKLSVFLGRLLLSIRVPTASISNKSSGRPRVRLANPVILFRPSAISGVPAQLNLLQPLQDDPAFKGLEPQLSALRISRITPTLHSDIPESRLLRNISQKAFRVVPGLGARVRYSRSNNSSSKPVIIASLDIETTSFVDHDIIIDTVELRLKGGAVDKLAPGHAGKLPLKCRPRDDVVLLYRLIPSENVADLPAATSNARTLDIAIQATVLVSGNCHPRIEMRWKAGVDFSIPLNPGYGIPAQWLQRTNRPASLPVTAANGTKGITPQTAQGMESISNPEILPEQKKSISTSDLGGLTVTFSGPQEVRVGNPFCWNVFVVNRSNKPRKLALVVIPKRRRAEVRKHIPKSSSSSAGGGKDGAFADAVVDENFLYAVQKAAAMDSAQLVSLSTDVRIGSVSSGPDSRRSKPDLILDVDL